LIFPSYEGLRRALERVSRIENAPPEDRFEREALTFHEKVREGYLYLARKEPERFRVIDGGKAVRDVYREVSSHLSKR